MIKPSLHCHRRSFLMLIVLWTATLALSACSSSSNSSNGGNGYIGISERCSTGSAKISSDGLVVAFDMETLTQENMLRDFSPHQHHSVLMGTMTTAGLFGNALQFRTATDRVDMPETPAFDMDGPISIALWLRIDTLGLHQHIIAVDDKFVVWINPANHIRFTDTLGDGIETQESVEAGRWYSLATVFDGVYGTQLSTENIRLYLDGDLVASTVIGRPPGEPPTWKPGQLYPSDAAYLGFESHQGESLHQGLQFEGVIDEVLVFSRALDFMEVIAHADRDE